MKVLTVFASKGGSGKSTIAIHMAVIASQQKRANRTLLIDYDVQQSSQSWAKRREAETPAVLPATSGNIGSYIDQAQDEFDLTVIDMPPHSATDAQVVLRRSDLVLVPVRPGAFDIDALEATVNAIETAGARGIFVLNQVPARGPDGDEAEEALKTLAPQVPVAKSRLILRKPFSVAFNAGLAITEFASPKEKAAVEAMSLFNEIKRSL